MTKRTTKIDETTESYFSTDFETGRRAVIENVKRNVEGRHALNKLVGEWVVAKEETKKWRLGK